MATGPLKQLQSGNGARAQKNVEAFDWKHVPSAYAVLLFHVQGMHYRKGLTETTSNY